MQSTDKDPWIDPARLNTKTHIREIDGLRGIAILCVIIYHLVALPLAPLFESKINVALKLLAHGVDLFFVISGYLIGRILLKVEGLSGIKTFYIRRILQIWPLYYLLLLIVYLILPEKSMFSEAPYWSFPFFIFNFWESFGKELHTALGPLWSIAIEEQFYLLAPVVFLVFNRKQLSFLLIIYVLLSPILRWALFVYNLNHADIDLWRFTPVRLDGICMGLLLAIFLSSNSNILFVAKRIKYFTALAFLLLTLLVPSKLMFSDIVWQSFGHSLIVLTFAFILLAIQVRVFINQEIYFLSFGFLRELGLHCYSIYLFHVFFALIIYGKFNNFFTGLIVELISVVLFSYFTWRYIEAPLIRLGQRFSYSNISI